ncbi:uncharacterized protein LOC113565521 [Drosophila persimilis]|uniref:uncharacterized protein LOC113565521 n=1 Tax=Drosophila persimilis TaxID=7234 RepID=UPI000F090A69|nr:uncharacterized protein LOC113565521 [Drosophila persimilis]
MGSSVDIPEVDMLSVSKSSEVERRAILGFAPRINLVTVDYGDLEKIDTFYLDSQRYRDYYRDPYDKLPKPERFKYHQGKCGIKLDHSVEQMRRPISWVEERKPVVYPLKYGTPMRLGTSAASMMRGRYDLGSCIRYKR